MAVRTLAPALMLATLTLCGSEVVNGQAAVADARPAFAAVTVSREHRYRVDGRARPFFFWIRKANVGDGRLTWRRGPDGEVGLSSTARPATRHPSR